MWPKDSTVVRHDTESCDRVQLPAHVANLVRMCVSPKLAPPRGMWGILDCVLYDVLDFNIVLLRSSSDSCHETRSDALYGKRRSCWVLKHWVCLATQKFIGHNSVSAHYLTSQAIGYDGYCDMHGPRVSLRHSATTWPKTKGLFHLFQLSVRELIQLN